MNKVKSFVSLNILTICFCVSNVTNAFYNEAVCILDEKPVSPTFVCCYNPAWGTGPPSGASLWVADQDGISTPETVCKNVGNSVSGFQSNYEAQCYLDTNTYGSSSQLIKQCASMNAESVCLRETYTNKTCDAIFSVSQK